MAFSVLVWFVVFCLAVYRFVLFSPVVSCRVLSCPVAFLALLCVAFGVVIFSCGSSGGNFCLWLLRWPFLLVALGCTFLICNFSIFQFRLCLMMTAKPHVNFGDQDRGPVLGTKTRRKLIARTVRAQSAGAKK